MTFGAGEDTDLQFDPRASRNVVSPGNIHHTIAGDYKVKSLRTATVNGVAGLFMSSPASTTVQGLAGMIINGPGGLNIAAAKTSIETADLDLVAAKTDITTADLNIDAAKVDITGSADVSITGANVRLTGALIYLN